MAGDAQFQGRIGRTWKDSTPWWPPAPAAPAGAPNVVFIVLDDVGYSDIGCYGSEIRTPRMDALAANGVRYSNFHVTAMCSPTRACLLTGRNAHSVGVGAIAEWANGFPGYEGRISRHAATAAEIFGEHAYGTYAIGKWHLSNLANYVNAGPHPDWPLGRGFSRWYGFLGGYVDHWNPDLHEDNHPIRHQPRPGYHLSEDLVDHAIAQVRDHVSSARGRPFMTYLAFGAGHWPLHVPRAYIERVQGRYDQGWDAIREARLAKQKAMGLVPQAAQLAPRNPGVQAWEELTAPERQVAARLQEAYAAFMEHTDDQIGRLADYLSSIGEYENTIFVLLSDNGASGEGGPTGALNIRKHLQTETETTGYVLQNLDLIGGEHSFPHYPQGWAQVSNTPLKWYKKNTHGGGIRAPLIISWPKGIAQRGEVRTQYHHVIDVLPTVMELAGVSAPSEYRGVRQLPIHGTSMAYTFADAAAPSRRPVQHFEMVGDRALYREGWKIVARHQKGVDFDADRWELYEMGQDYSEVNDLAAAQPERVQSMVKLWWEEAERFGVLPLDDRESERALDWFRSSAPSRYRYLPGMARADRLMIPAINGRNYRVLADVDFGAGAAQGAILAFGNRFAGIALYCSGGELVFDYIYSEAKTLSLRLPQPAGRQQVRVLFEQAGERKGRFTLEAAGSAPQAMDVPRTWTTYGVTAGLTCGYVNVPIVPACPVPAAFSGSIGCVDLELLDGAPRADGGFAAMLQEE
ncbi:arylsulfatase [Ramlibacter sp. G-1-2-2]|uniref:Arylsulfatase n=1 Tax=Ramlibacter agri TaxID=2728837 RepID=A0A848H126_9BURK|nr:arylsulfatase [Ramlibacter agri]NML44274.1 arylsulfatase [Ramlibacter agri]